MSILVNLFHILIVAPILFLLGMKKIDWIVPYLPYVAVFMALTHTKLAFKKYKKGEQLFPKNVEEQQK